MVKQTFPAIIPIAILMVLLSSCSTFKPLNFSSNRQVASAPANLQTKFIDDISMTPPGTVDNTEVKPEHQVASGTTRGHSFRETLAEKQESDQIFQLLASRSIVETEAASSVQRKYAALLKTEVDLLPSTTLLENVDEWYGVRYRKGGNTKKGIDCSGFTEAVYAAVYGIMLPAVSREQYRISRKISTTEIEEGDLVFFNTTGGISHVGIYLGNNKFIHATVSKGVMVNGLFEPYYLKRYLGAGRIDDKRLVSN